MQVDVASNTFDSAGAMMLGALRLLASLLSSSAGCKTAYLLARS